MFWEQAVDGSRLGLRSGKLGIGSTKFGDDHRLRACVRPQRRPDDNVRVRWSKGPGTHRGYARLIFGSKLEQEWTAFAKWEIVNMEYEVWRRLSYKGVA